MPSQINFSQPLTPDTMAEVEKVCARYDKPADTNTHKETDQYVDDDEKQTKTPRPHRNRNVSEVLCSPYIQRVIRLSDTPTRDETMVADYIFSATDNLWDEVISVGGGLTAMRVMMETLCPGVCVHVNVLVLWAKFLNHEEAYRRKGTMRRLFCPPIMLVDADYDVNKKSRLSRFTSNMNSVLEAQQLTDLTGVDLLFIPMISNGHYYLMCFNLKQFQTDIIDNSAVNDDSLLNYGGRPVIMRNTLVDYLLGVSFFNARRLKTTPIVRLTMAWRTTENESDCGVFVMRHMETYHGRHSTWNCGLVSENDGRGTGSNAQRKQLSILRIKYVAKMLLHDLNILKNDVTACVTRYSRLDDETRQAMDETSVSRIIERTKMLD